MRQSNSYIVIFALGLCIVVGGLLSLAAVGLRPAQQKAEALDRKKQILGAVLPDVGERPAKEINQLYDERVESLVVNYEGEPVEGSVAEAVEIGREYKKKPKDRLYPVFKYKESPDAQEVKAYILPLYGNGLWNNIWAYIALNNDMETIEGIKFDHVGETPGLGARITGQDVQMRYKGKKILDDEGKFMSVTMLKGENNAPESINAHEVDGMSGATLTADGVNDMMEKYLGYYLQGYFVTLEEDAK